jgi:hypothetical protein
LAGAWTNNDFLADGFDAPDGAWREHISLVIPEYIVAETFWRVLEHPWNIENELAGLWIENQEPYRFYLLEGDLAQGVGMAIHPWEPDGQSHPWEPLEPDSDTNHPSFGKRFYLRFEVVPSDNMWNEQVRVQKFLTADEARNGFTDEAVTYWRGFRYP